LHGWANFSRPETNLNDCNIFEQFLNKTPAGTVVAETGYLGQGRGLASNA
jgi:hypothetical protein